MNKKLYIPTRWKDKAYGYTDSNGWSPARVTKITTESDCFYLKSVDAKKYASTTYSVKRETDVMQWLDGKLIVPKVIDFGLEKKREYLVMSELRGTYIDELKENPDEYIPHLARCIKLIQAVDISVCPFDSSLNVRLNELNYLMQRGLASIDTEDWEPTTKFTDPNELYRWLCSNRPAEEPAFSHGDLTANIFVDGSEYCFYDLGRAGIADKWLDIAFCVCDIRSWYGDKKYEDQFFELLGIQPNYEKIEYFILLDEMF